MQARAQGENEYNGKMGEEEWMKGNTKCEGAQDK